VDERYLNKEMSEGGEPPIPIPSVDRAWADMEQLLDDELPVTFFRYGWCLGVKVVVMVLVMFSLKGGNVSTVSLKEQDDVIQYVNNKPEASLINVDTISAINEKDIKTREIPDIESEISNTDKKEMTGTGNNKPEIEILTADSKNKKGITNTKNNKPETEILNTGNRNKKEITSTKSNTGKRDLLNADNKNKKEVRDTKNNKNKQKRQKEDFITDDNQNSLAGSPSSPGSPWIYGSSSGFSRTVLNLSTLPLSKEDPKKLMHKDMQISLLSTAAKKDTAKLRSWSFWVQLNTPIPLYDSKYYSTAPKGNDQFYRNLIPSIRIKKKIGKSFLSADLQPFTSLLLPLSVSPSKPDSSAPGDTLGIPTVKRKMVKQFGSGITLQYHYPLYKNWTMSAGIGGAWWQKAIITQTTQRDTTASVTTVLAATKDDWKGYPRFIFTGTIELYYDTPKWQMGLRTAVPLNESTGRRLQLEFLLRRRIR
jgi:hypothetical protein